MSKKNESRPGPSFLGRLARFVRHPTTDWAQTQFHPGERLSAAQRKAQQRESKKMQRAAVLVRDREFDVLRREMHNRKSLATESLEGLSIPSTLLPPPLRAVSRQHTLHKIDAIERQIQEEQRLQNSATLPGGMLDDSGLAQVGFAASALRPGSHRRSHTPRWGHSQLLQPSRLQTTLPYGARATRPPSPWGHTVLPIPAVIELAAFDFAEGRDAQVESQLLTGLQTEPGVSMVQQIFQALLDFYWATDQQDKLQSRTLDYVQRYGQTPMPRPELDALQSANPHAASFIAAEQFDILQLRAFEHFVAEASTHLILDWSALVSLSEAQQAPLTEALKRLNDRPVELELHGADMLLAATRLQSSAASAAETALRLQVLRLLGDEAGFVDLAVELSIACACSPVDWTPARFKRVDTAERGLTSLHSLHRQTSRTATRADNGDAGLVQTSVRLSGNLSSADESFLRTLRAQAGRADAIILELHAVRRMDFAAAANLLNWVVAQSQLGKSVELHGAHTLLAPFLRSVGLQVLT